MNETAGAVIAKAIIGALAAFGLLSILDKMMKKAKPDDKDKDPQPSK